MSSSHFVGIHLFDMQSGKEINPNEPFKHSVEIARLQLAQSGPSHCRLLAFVDRNSDLYVLMPNSVKSNGKQSSNVAVKLASMVDSFRWNESNHLLCAIVDGKPKVWYYPAVVFIDPDILEYTATEVLAAQDFDGNTSTEHSITLRGGYILGFFGTQCLVRRMDGALCHVAGISPYPVILMEVLKKKQADEAVRLCRFVKVFKMYSIFDEFSSMQFRVDMLGLLLLPCRFISTNSTLPKLRTRP